VLHKQQCCKRLTDLIILSIGVESIKKSQACLLRSRITTILIDRIEYTGIVAQPQRIGGCRGCATQAEN
jgi:hypothetical protein